MATLQEITDAQAAQTQAITDLANRIAALPTGVTPVQLDPVLASVQASTAAIATLAQPPA